MLIKVRHDKRSILCNTCSYGQVMEYASGRIDVICNESSPGIRLPQAVVKCSAYVDKATTSEYDLKQIAWTIRTDKSGKVLGFAPPKKSDSD